MVTNLPKISLNTLKQLHGAGDKWITKKTLATALKIKPNAVAYRVKPLLELNLIQTKIISKSARFKLTPQGRQILQPPAQANPLQNI